MTTIGPVVARCLGSGEIKSIAGGRLTERELAVVRQHLSECARCRAAVAARAAGVPGPGETVLLRAQPKAAFPTGLKLASVVASLALVAAAWRYTAAPKNQHAPAASEAGAAALSVASAGSAPTLDQPGALASSPAARVPSPRDDAKHTAIAEPVQPTVRVAVIPSETVPTEVIPPETVPRDPARSESAPARRTARRPRPLTRAEPAKPEVPAEGDEFDFGIDEPSAVDAPTPTRPGSRRRAIRTTLE